MFRDQRLLCPRALSLPQQWATWCAFACGLAAISTCSAESPAFPPAAAISASDSLQIGTETAEDARLCLEGLVWSPGEFDVQCRAPDDESCSAVVTFASPVPSGDAVNDRVVLEWYAAHDGSGQPIRAPAVVVVHESGSRMTVGRLIAQGFRPLGVHAFLIHLPQYGQRRTGDRRPDGAQFLQLIRQAVADVRRARDAVAALPLVDADRIALQGTSLGGIISATVAGLDHGYDRVFLMLAGGDLYELLQNGQRDAAKFREELQRAGLTGDKLRAITQVVEPLRLAPRIDPQRTWLYTADYDQVVPAVNSDRLSAAMRLSTAHHVRLAADHYTGIIYLPLLLEQMAQEIRAADGAAGPPANAE